MMNTCYQALYLTLFIPLLHKIVELNVSGFLWHEILTYSCLIRAPSGFTVKFYECNYECNTYCCVSLTPRLGALTYGALQHEAQPAWVFKKKKKKRERERERDHTHHYWLIASSIVTLHSRPNRISTKSFHTQYTYQHLVEKKMFLRPPRGVPPQGWAWGR